MGDCDYRFCSFGGASCCCFAAACVISPSPLSSIAAPNRNTPPQEVMASSQDQILARGERKGERREEGSSALSLPASELMCTLVFHWCSTRDSCCCLIFLMCRYRLLLCDCVLLFQHLWQLFALHITCAHLCVSCEAGSSVVSCFPHRCCSLLAPNHISSTDAWLQKSE